jgi:hypothetical protein
MVKKCEFRRKDGKSCNANIQVGKSSCVFHDPDKVSEGQRARRAGGLRRSHPAPVLPPDTPDHPLRNTIDISAFLAETINQVRRGVIDPRVANCMGQLASVMLRSLEQGPLEIRMARLEAALDIAKNPHTATAGKETLPV